MRFRLTYRGPLKPQMSGDKIGKQNLRRHFHPQIKSLWETIMVARGSSWNPLKVPNNPGEVGICQSMSSFLFAPLVSQAEGWNAIAQLDVLFLRPSRPGEPIKHGGDLDNRIKVLFDGLRMPRNLDEVPTSDQPGPGETPFHCLLQDDSLITAFSVTSDQLLNPPDPDHVELIISVNVQTTRRTLYNDIIW